MTFDIHHCTLCPRQCGADRTQRAGVCGGRDGILAARASLHLWEEPVLCGTRGAGTVFFSGCPLHCRFCQNAVISETPFGKPLSPARLGEIMLDLQGQGAHCIDLVTAGHFLPWVAEALALVKDDLAIPVVWNSGGYERPEALAMLEGLVDIWLPDFKFFDPETARRYANAPDYPTVAMAALETMLQMGGAPVVEDGLMRRGTIVRHLVLPGHRHESIALLRSLADRFGTDAFLLSLMAQYTPMHPDPGCPELERRVTKMEYRSVADTAAELGFSGFTQDKSSADSSYTPDFSLQGL